MAGSALDNGVRMAMNRTANAEHRVTNQWPAIAECILA